MTDRYIAYYALAEGIHQIVAWAEGPLEKENEIGHAVGIALERLKEQDGAAAWKDKKLIAGMCVIPERQGDEVLIWHLPSEEQTMKDMTLGVAELRQTPGFKAAAELFGLKFPKADD